MGLDIMSVNENKHFHISYIGFSTMRSFFILHYDEKSYHDYTTILRGLMTSTFESVSLYQKIFEKIGDLSILIDHSDCDGKLTTQECEKLKKCLFVDENKIKKVYENQEYRDRMIEKMYEFIDLIDYCSEHNDVELIFG